MKRILFIHFRRLGDLLGSSKMIESYRQQYPDVEISLLTFRESSHVKKMAHLADFYYSIDRHKILTMIKNKIFSNGFALDYFLKEVRPLKEIEWDEVINLSNDRISTFLTSYLSSQEKKGLSFDRDHTIAHSSDWSILFNDIITRQFVSPIHFVDNQLEICQGSFTQHHVPIYLDRDAMAMLDVRMGDPLLLK